MACKASEPRAPATPSPVASSSARPHGVIAAAPPTVSVTASASSAPSAAVGAPPEDYRAWIKRVPAGPVRVPVGELAWAAVPVGDFVRFEPFKVTAISGNVATLEDG